MKVAIFSMQGLGNCIIPLPILLKLKEHFDVDLYVMNPASYKFYTSFNELGINIKKLNSVKDILSLSTPKYDLAFSFYPNWRREICSLYKTKSKKKYIFNDPQFTLTKLNRFNKINIEECHDIENSVQILEQLGIPFDETDFKDVISKLNVKKYCKRELVVLHPTASMSEKYYPHSFWNKIIQKFLDEKKEICLISNSKVQEVQFCRELMDKFDNATSIYYLCEPSFPEIIKHLHEASIFIGLDSSVMHLAAMLDVKLIALWSFAEFRKIYPYGNNSSVYIPKETVTLEKQRYAKRTKIKTEWKKRARGDDIIKIIDSKMNKSFTIKPNFKKEPVNFYVF